MDYKKFVRDWMWDGDGRGSDGEPWSHIHVREMIACVTAFHATVAPFPRPASELTPERLAAWPDWMAEFNIAGRSLWRMRSGRFVDRNAVRVYPIRPDLALGPIPATWDEVDAAVAKMKEATPHDWRTDGAHSNEHCARCGAVNDGPVRLDGEGFEPCIGGV